MNFAKTKSEIAKQLKKTTNYMSNKSKLLNNKYLLYLVLVLVIVDMFLFVNVGEVFYIFLYILFGLLVSLYSGNIMIILASAMILTNIVKLLMRMRVSGNEGFETASLNLGAQIFESLKEDEQEYFRNIAKGKLEPLSNLSPDEQVIQEQIIDYLNNEEEESPVEERTNDGTSSEEKGTNGGTSPVEKGGNGGNSPVEKGTNGGISPVEDQVQKLIGFSDESSKPTLEGLDELDTEAKNLIKTQKELYKNMKNLEPMLNQAKNLMKDLNNIKK